MAAGIEHRVNPRGKDLGGFEVRRVLPYAQRRMVGPFIFFDHLGPATFEPGTGIDVRPHPHIGLATVTYLFEGALMHRDSLGYVHLIEPGAVNWMTAGSGIVHSERTDETRRREGHTIHAIQSWVALPKSHEEMDPAFAHHPAASLPTVDLPGVRMHLIAGTAYGAEAPVAFPWGIFYVHADVTADTSFDLPDEHEERAVYLVDGNASVDGEALEPRTMAIFAPGGPVCITASAGATLMLLGGAKMDGERKIWWNFVSSNPERLEKAKQDWREGRFAAVPGETEFIPLPES